MTNKKLKTLKDLDKEWLSNYGDMLLPRVNGENELCKDLRQAAKEWVEFNKVFVDKELTEHKNNETERKMNIVRTLAVDSWIKHFFNLEEE